MLAAVAEPGWPVGYTTKSAVQLAVVRLGPYLAGEALGCTVAVAPPLSELLVQVNPVRVEVKVMSLAAAPAESDVKVTWLPMLEPVTPVAVRPLLQVVITDERFWARVVVLVLIAKVPAV